MQNYYNQIKNSPIFFGLSEDELKEMLTCFNARVNKNHTYEDKKLIEMISDAISIWKQYSTPVSGGTASFNETFNAIKNRTTGIEKRKRRNKNLPIIEKQIKK